MENVTSALEAWGLPAAMLSSFPLEAVADRLSNKLPKTMPSSASIFGWIVVTILLLAILEQIKYRIGRIGTKTSLPGGVLTHAGMWLVIGIEGNRFQSAH